jgi:hypothetical protein
MLCLGYSFSPNQPHLILVFLSSLAALHVDGVISIVFHFKVVPKLFSSSLALDIEDMDVGGLLVLLLGGIILTDDHISKFLSARILGGSAPGFCEVEEANEKIAVEGKYLNFDPKYRISILA